MRRLLILLLSLTLFAAACGDDGDDTSTTEADDDGGDDDGGDDDGGDDDGGDDDSGDGDGGDDDGGPDEGAGAGSDFCDLWTDDTDDFGTDSLNFTASPEELEDSITRNLEALDDVRGSAPSEIRGDLDVIYDNFSGVADVLAANGWDILAAGQDMTDLDSDATTQATENIDAYCGAEPDDFGSAPPVDPGGVLDPDLIEDLENVDPEDAEALGLLIWQSLGHDEETAQCLVDEIGTFDDLPEDPGPDFMTQEFCGLTMIQIMTGG